MDFASTYDQSKDVQIAMDHKYALMGDTDLNVLNAMEDPYVCMEKYE